MKRLRISLLQSDDIDEEEQDNHDIDSTTADTVLNIASGLINVATLMHSPIDGLRGPYNRIPKCRDFFHTALTWPDREFQHTFRCACTIVCGYMG